MSCNILWHVYPWVPKVKVSMKEEVECTTFPSIIVDYPAVSVFVTVVAVKPESIIEIDVSCDPLHDVWTRALTKIFLCVGKAAN